MGKVAAYHTTLSETPEVYHDRDDCSEGKKIKAEHKEDGTDGRQKCKVCASLG